MHEEMSDKYKLIDILQLCWYFFKRQGHEALTKAVWD